MTLLSKDLLQVSCSLLKAPICDLRLIPSVTSEGFDISASQCYRLFSGVSWHFCRLFICIYISWQVLIKQEIQRKSGYAIQVDEEHLRVQLDTIQSELNAPTQFKVSVSKL